MPTVPRRDNLIVTLFVSEYEKGAWKDADLTFPDQREDGGIDGLAKRADGSTLPIEHTIVQPFLRDIADQTEMIPMLASIENDKALVVPNIWIQVFVPTGTLHQQPLNVREAIGRAIHDWLRTSRLSLPKGDSEHSVGVPGKSEVRIVLTLKVIDLPGAGQINLRRQQVENTLGDVVKQALTKKLPKLAKANATKRLLLVERQHMILFPQSIGQEIDKCRNTFPELSFVDEIWIVEKIPFFQANAGDVGFELYSAGKIRRGFFFNNGTLY